jgi:hypothetical protein
VLWRYLMALGAVVEAKNAADLDALGAALHDVGHQSLWTLEAVEELRKSQSSENRSGRKIVNDPHRPIRPQ